MTTRIREQRPRPHGSPANAQLWSLWRRTGPGAGRRGCVRSGARQRRRTQPVAPGRKAAAHAIARGSFGPRGRRPAPREAEHNTVANGPASGEVHRVRPSVLRHRRSSTSRTHRPGSRLVERRSTGGGGVGQVDDGSCGGVSPRRRGSSKSDISVAYGPCRPVLSKARPQRHEPNGRGGSRELIPTVLTSSRRTSAPGGPLSGRCAGAGCVRHHCLVSIRDSRVMPSLQVVHSRADPSPLAVRVVLDLHATSGSATAAAVVLPSQPAPTERVHVAATPRAGTWWTRSCGRRWPATGQRAPGRARSPGALLGSFATTPTATTRGGCTSSSRARTVVRSAAGPWPESDTAECSFERTFAGWRATNRVKVRSNQGDPSCVTVHYVTSSPPQWPWLSWPWLPRAVPHRRRRCHCRRPVSRRVQRARRRPSTAAGPLTPPRTLHRRDRHHRKRRHSVADRTGCGYTRWRVASAEMRTPTSGETRSESPTRGSRNPTDVWTEPHVGFWPLVDLSLTYSAVSLWWAPDGVGPQRPDNANTSALRHRLPRQG